MIEEIKTHFWDYLILFLLIGAGVICFIYHPDKIVKFQISILMALAYIFWGVFHHLSEKNLNLKIVVEYTLIGLLSIILLGGVLL